MSAVTPISSCRQATRERDRSLRDKVMSLEEAAKLVSNGEHVALGGCTASRTPMAMLWALIRAGTRDLTVSRSIVSTEGDLLYASGALQPHHHQLVQPGHRLGRLQGDARLYRERAGALRGMEPHGDGPALPRRRHGRAVPADALHARLRRARPGGGREDHGMPLHRRDAAAGAGAEPGCGADPCAALRSPSAMRRSTA